MSTPPPVPESTVLVIDDEPQIRRLLRVTLEAAGYRMLDSEGGEDGIVAVARRRPDVVLLDLGLPDIDGMDVLRRIREWSRVPVVVLTVRDREDDKIAALDAGADDYVTKPFGTGELLARIRAALRHAKADGVPAVFRSGDFEMDLSARVVRCRQREVRLTPIEYDLLRLLVTHVGKVVTHRRLLGEIWGARSVEQTHYLRVHVANLRAKVEDDPSRPRRILTEPAIGYRFAEE